VVREEGVELVRCDERDLIRYVSEGKIDHAPNLAVLLLAAVKGRLSVCPGADPTR
jgi:hypothetical protein